MNKTNTDKNMKGYKVFNPDFTCKGFQYEENKEYKTSQPISICESGFHFCIKAQHCFNYYEFNPENIICEVEALGETQTHGDDSKVCTNYIAIGKRLTWAEVLVVANDGVNNTGHSNSGYSNSGNSNSGYRNSGYRNSGNWNSGDSNSGDSNSGDSNSGNSNSGYRNSGYRNSGDSNSGYRNSGDSNSGYSNSGNSNSGNWNSGDRNSGDSNSGYRNSGAFSTDNNPFLVLFDKPTSIRVRDWENTDVCNLMYNIEPTIFVPMSLMTDEEKASHPKYETTEGYLKTILMKEAWANFWGNLTDEKKKMFIDLPNFDAAKFEEITGVRV